MTGDRISIPEIRKHPSGETSAQGEWRWSEDVILALVEAVEKSLRTFDQIAADGWNDGDVGRMRRWAEDASEVIRARFDFGERETDPVLEQEC